MYVCQLSFKEIKQLSRLLDANGDWEKLAGQLRLSVSQVNRLRTSASPTEAILRLYGATGSTVADLLSSLAEIGMENALALLKHHVTEQEHILLVQRAASAASEILESAAVSAALSDHLNHAMNYSQMASTDLSEQPLNSHRSPQVSSQSERKSTVTTDASTEKPCSAVLNSVLSVSYADLFAATDSFSQDKVIGKGGYGVVYVAEWQHTQVAVKRMVELSQAPDRAREHMKQLLMELQSLSVYRHDNILPLYGHCIDGPEPCIVYQLMSNGSLDDRLHSRIGEETPLSIDLRLSILAGTARGINFLHTCAKQPLIHGDVKSANVLLDSSFVPKLGDFGLARKGFVDELQPLIVSHVKGTLAYLPPEFVFRKNLTTALDVYSFGVVIAETLTGLRAYSEARRLHFLTEHVKSKLKHSKNSSFPTDLLNATVPWNCESEKDVQMLSELFDLSLRCWSEEVTKRPSISEVYSVIFAHLA